MTKDLAGLSLVWGVGPRIALPPKGMAAVVGRLCPAVNPQDVDPRRRRMKHYPILFTFVDKVSGNGFLAKVAAHGRALVAQEEDGWWMYGVQPGDLAAGGTTFAEAHAEFRKTFRAILFDIAEEAKDIKSFRTEIGRFFRGVNHPTEEEWKAAVREVRAGKITADVLSVGFPTKPANSPRSIQVNVLKSFQPKDNVFDPQMAVAA